MATIPLPRPHARPAAPEARASRLARRPLVSFFALAFAGTWALLAPLALGRGEHGLGLLPIAIPGGADFLLAQLSAYAGPLLAAILVTAATEGREGLRRFRRRVFRWRFGPGWYLLALLAPLTIWLGAYAAALGGDPLAALARQPMLLLSTFLPFVALGLVMPSLGEEPGWRGFALPRLQARCGPLGGTLALGALHALWHLPMFFTPNLGPFGAAKVASFALTAVAATVLYTWVVNRAGGSVIPAILLHAAGNASSGLLNRLVPVELPLDGWALALVQGGWLNAIAFGLVALVLVAATRGRLGRRAEGESQHA
jgi:membrane protease YdiL (CAAX protease family)